MKKQKGFTLIELVVALAFIFLPVFWIWNMVKLTDCDFESPYKCEVIHGIGVVPAFAPITVWFATDEKG